MDKGLLEHAVDIVLAQITLNKMSAEEIETTLIKVFNALNKIYHAEKEGRGISADEHAPGEISYESHPARISDPSASIQEDKVICLECGAEFRQLTANHLRSHGLTPREYKKKWGFPLKQPLAARILTKLRSKSAKKRGLPQRLQEYLQDQRERKRGVESGESSTAEAGRH